MVIVVFQNFNYLSPVNGKSLEFMVLHTLTCGLLYFRILTICLLLVYFVSAAGCHCFDFDLYYKCASQVLHILIGIVDVLHRYCRCS